MNTVKVVAYDYIGWQVSASIAKMKLEYKNEALRVIINSLLYRVLIKNVLPEFFKNLFSSVKDPYIQNIMIDFIALSILNVISINFDEDKSKSKVLKTIMESGGQSIISNILQKYTY